MTDVSHGDRGRVVASCHCGAVGLELPAPLRVTQCNCSLCRKYGVLWAYFPIAEVRLTPAEPSTDTYSWNGRNVDFHRCRNCGCLTHWLPRDPRRDRMGVNARLLEPDVLASAEIHRRDAAGTGLF